MLFRIAKEDDLNEIMSIIEEAKAYLKVQGVDQWQNGYPNEEKILEDIASEESYVGELNGKIVATGYLSFCGEKTYEKIYNGQWLSIGPYAVYHRTAVSEKSRNAGIAKDFFQSLDKVVLEKGVKSIRIDTHKDNMPMQKFLKKNGYIYCGVIYLEDGNERVAFEKIL